MSKELEKNYNPQEIEGRLYEKWMDAGYFHAEVDRSKKPFTIVMPPPNITGQLHMGHAFKNTDKGVGRKKSHECRQVSLTPPGKLGDKAACVPQTDPTKGKGSWGINTPVSNGWRAVPSRHTFLGTSGWSG